MWEVQVEYRVNASSKSQSPKGLYFLDTFYVTGDGTETDTFVTSAVAKHLRCSWVPRTPSIVSTSTTWQPFVAGRVFYGS